MTSRRRPSTPPLLAQHGVTQRESDVLAAIGRRLTNAEIAAELGIAKRTVESHVSSLMSKLGVHDRLTLVRLAAGSDPARAARPGARTTPRRTASRAVTVGRDREVQLLTGWLDGVDAGAGVLVTLVGEPGIGKTQLVQEIAERAERRGLLCLVGHCPEAPGVAALTPVAEILAAAYEAVGPETFRAALAEDAERVAALVPAARELTGEPAPPLPLPAEQARRVMLTAVRATLERLAAAVPLLLVFEDVHRADRATLLLLEELVTHSGGAPVLLLATHAGSDTDLWPRLGAVLARLAQARRLRQVPLAPLDQEAVAQLLTARLGRPAPDSLARSVHARTDGNPFFVHEFVALLGQQDLLYHDDSDRVRIARLEAAELPDTVRLVIGDRLNRLRAPTRTVLQCAAVMGRTFDVDVLEAALAPDGAAGVGQDDVLAAIDEASAAGLVVPDAGSGDQLAFAHSLVREVLVRRLSDPRRRHLHLQLAQAWMRRPAAQAEAHAEEIADHLVAAGGAADPADVVRFCLLAGRHCLAASATGAALVHLERAEARLAGTPDAQQGEVHEALGAARFSAGRTDAALAAWARSLDSYERAGTVDGVGRVCRTLGRLLTHAGRLPEAAALLRRGLGLLGTRRSADRAVVLGRLGLIVTFAGEPGRGEELLTDAVALADEVGEPGARAIVLGDRARACHGTLRLAQATSAGRDGARAAGLAGDPSAAADALWPAAWDLACLGRLDEAAAARAELVPLAERLHSPGVTASARAADAVAAFLRTGDVAAYADAARRDVRFVEEHLGGAWLGTSLSFLAHAEFLRGNRTAADELAARGPVNCTPALAGFCTGLQLLLHGYAGRRDAALALLDEHRTALPVAGAVNNGGAWGLALAAAESLSLLGDHERAHELYPVVLEAQQISGALTANFAPLQLLERVAGIAAAAGQRWDDAEQHFHAALEQAEQAPYAVERYDTRRCYAQMLRDRGGSGDRDRAVRLLADAEAGYRRLAMPRHAELARSARAATSR